MSTILLKIPPKREEEGSEGGERGERAKRAANSLHNQLELRLGMSLDIGLESGKLKSPNGGAKRSFCEASDDFIHPWSLAARQEKAALEQAHQKPSSIVSRTTNASLVVGWPPLCSFRKNLLGLQAPKIAAETEKSAEKARIVEEGKKLEKFGEKLTMFVKVNMEGCGVGRKIDLKAHDSYDSLSSALQKMFQNFLSANHFRNEEGDEVKFPNYILLYEDSEGDRILVGDVPWEMFISSAKRLYITQDPRTTRLTTTELKSKPNGAEMV